MKNELQTTTEPFEWIFKFKEPVSNSEIYNAKIQSYSCLLIALIDNLNAVTMNYCNANDGFMFDIYFNTKDCSKFVGSDIKEFSKSPEKIQKLLNILDIH